MDHTATQERTGSRPCLTFMAKISEVSRLRTWNTLPKAPCPTMRSSSKSLGPSRWRPLVEAACALAGVSTWVTTRVAAASSAAAASALRLLAGLPPLPPLPPPPAPGLQALGGSSVWASSSAAWPRGEGLAGEGIGEGPTSCRQAGGQAGRQW